MRAGGYKVAHKLACSPQRKQECLAQTFTAQKRLPGPNLSPAVAVYIMQLSEARNYDKPRVARPARYATPDPT